MLAMDADWLVDDIVAALGNSDTSFTVCSDGRRVSEQVAAVSDEGGVYDLAVVDVVMPGRDGLEVTE